MDKIDVSVGELIDKFSILEIKLDNIKNNIYFKFLYINEIFFF